MTTSDRLNSLTEYLRTNSQIAVTQQENALAAGNWTAARSAYARAYTLARLSHCLSVANRLPADVSLLAAQMTVSDERGGSGILDDLVDLVLADLACLQEVEQCSRP